MGKIGIHTVVKKGLADLYTPAGIYLRLRDRFRDTILLESTDSHSAENSYSFIGINAIAGIEMLSEKQIEWKLPGEKAEQFEISASAEIVDWVPKFMDQFSCQAPELKEGLLAQGLFGYTSFDTACLVESVKTKKNEAAVIPFLRYRLYQYVIAINHFKDALFICENQVDGIKSEFPLVESLIRSKDIPVYPFTAVGEETSNMSDEDYIDLVKKGIASCLRGDVFQIVLSRSYSQSFIGDEFNVYRALRSINPSPYLFYFDYGNYKLMGSSPEAQIIVKNGKAVVHPIAGTFLRTGDDATDKASAEKLLSDAKENAEHVMLVDLARNDLSRVCDEVQVSHFREVQYFSHVIHLVSEVVGQVKDAVHPFKVLAKTFPAGTLSGAPKIRAMELIDTYEPTKRGFYGGTIGFLGFNGSCNHAIMIRSFLSQKNILFSQAGAGVVAVSKPESELQEVKNKLGALKKAVVLASNL
jgi:anthranilate synthase component 1